MDKEKKETSHKEIKTPSLNEPVVEDALNLEKQNHSHHRKDMQLFAQRPSLLSSENTTSGYRGFLNLMIILLVCQNFRLVVENLLNHGLLLSPQKYFEFFIKEGWRMPAVAVGSVLFLFVFNAYFIEQFLASNKISEQQGFLLNGLNILGCIFFPSALVWIVKPNPATGLVVMLFVVCWSMKLYSYAFVNYNLRQEVKNGKQGTGYPQNLTIQNLLFLLIIPTLCYRLEYPRTPSIRWGYLFRRVVEAIFLSLLILAIVEQYIVPLVRSSIKPIDSFDIWMITERLLKLSVPNLYVWLLGFYVLFHLYLNILAEITHFGDRLFYRDWWNSTSLAYYWRTWNMPVHTWMLVHVYTPMINKNYSKTQAYLACFFISAVFHELVIAVPFQIIKLWSFFGIMAQIPLIILTSGLRGNQAGNVIFWFSIVLGQPFLVLMMYRAWFEKNYGLAVADTPLHVL